MTTFTIKHGIRIHSVFADCLSEALDFIGIDEDDDYIILDKFDWENDERRD